MVSSSFGLCGLNMDEASKNGLIAECGDILIRGCLSEWLGGFARYLGSYNTYIVELWGVLERLILSKKLRCRSSKVVVQNILNSRQSSII